MTPPLVVIPAGSPAAKAIEREVFVTVTNGSKGGAQSSVAIELPEGWKSTPASVPLKFAHEDESLSARFQVTAPARVKLGDYTLRAVVTAGSGKFSSGYYEIDYPHVERRQDIKPAEVALKVVDVKTTPNVSVGYIVGAGDQVPPAIEQLGANLSFIDQDELAWGDLSKYRVIMTGVRAYETRKDLRAYNHRLLDYVERGGTAIVQYNKMEFNQSQYGPFPAKVSGNRVCDETVPVKILAPSHPVFNTPNRIGPATWNGLGAGARSLLPGRKGPEIRGPDFHDGFVQGQSRREARLAGGSEIRQRALDLSRSRTVASIAGGNGRSVSVAGQPDQFVELTL